MDPSNPAGFFTHDHRHCDDLWAKLENAPEADRAQCFAAFERAMAQHFAMEEEVLFPALEAHTGMRGAGPTHIMRLEHEQMRGLLRQMSELGRAGDFEAVLDQGDTLLMLIQQHNVKEESVLYPMADAVLAPSWSELSAKLAKYRS